MNNGDAATVRQVLKNLEPRARQQLLAECLASAFETLPASEQNALRAMQQALADQIRNLGDKTTLEILGAMGLLWHSGEHES
jgi:hypothetical protein